MLSIEGLRCIRIMERIFKSKIFRGW